MGYAILIALAVIFYRIGEHEYRSGWPLAGASLVLSFLGSYIFAFFGMIGANVLLYIGLTVYNIVSKRPPGSSSGF
jgi:uncharacterized membrane protein YfcA